MAKKVRLNMTVSREVRDWLKENDWFNASYELEKIVRAEMDKGA